MSEGTAIESLQELGLTEYQSRAYVAAVRLGTARPNELADESGVPQARVYDVIDALEDRGLVEVHQRSGGKEVTAPSPEQALDGLKQRHISEFTETVNDVATSLSRLHEHKRASGRFVSMVSHRESALRHARNAIESAEWWLTLSLSSTLYRRLAGDVEAALDRGVTVRLLLRADDGDARSGEALPSRVFPEGLRVRYREIADTFVLADREYGVYSSARPLGEAEPYIIMQEPNLVLVFQSYADQIWPASQVVRTGGGFPRRYLDPWRAITDLGEELETGEAFVATVAGRETETGRSDAWTGEVVGYDLAGPTDADFSAAIPVTASLTVETADGKLSVGGWKARVEDVAADGLEIARR